MAAPIITAKRLLAAKLREERRRGIYRIKGKFAKKSAYTAYAKEQRTDKLREGELRRQWGAPPRGWQWLQIASKYPERFEGYVET